MEVGDVFRLKPKEGYVGDPPMMRVLKNIAIGLGLREPWKYPIKEMKVQPLSKNVPDPVKRPFPDPFQG